MLSNDEFRAQEKEEDLKKNKFKLNIQNIFLWKIIITLSVLCIRFLFCWIKLKRKMFSTQQEKEQKMRHEFEYKSWYYSFTNRDIESTEYDIKKQCNTCVSKLTKFFFLYINQNYLEKGHKNTRSIQKFPKVNAKMSYTIKPILFFSRANWFKNISFTALKFGHLVIF